MMLKLFAALIESKEKTMSASFLLMVERRVTSTPSLDSILRHSYLMSVM